jgi:hypothetical protein
LAENSISRRVFCGSAPWIFKYTILVYTQGKPFHPIDPLPFHDVLWQLDSPDPLSSKYAITMAAESIQIKTPERLFGYVLVYQESGLVTTINLTPSYRCGAPHR